MTLTEKIFVRLEEEGTAWSDFSLAQAVRGMEDEEDLYSLDDLEAAF